MYSQVKWWQPFFTEAAEEPVCPSTLEMKFTWKAFKNYSINTHTNTHTFSYTWWLMYICAINQFATKLVSLCLRACVNLCCTSNLGNTRCTSGCRKLNGNEVGQTFRRLKRQSSFLKATTHAAAVHMHKNTLYMCTYVCVCKPSEMANWMSDQGARRNVCKMKSGAPRISFASLSGSQSVSELSMQVWSMPHVVACKMDAPRHVVHQ